MDWKKNKSLLGFIILAEKRSGRSIQLHKAPEFISKRTALFLVNQWDKLWRAKKMVEADKILDKLFK